MAKQVWVRVDGAAAAALDSLVGTLETSNVGELVRRAIRALPLANEGDAGRPDDALPGRDLHCRLPPVTYAALAAYRERTGETANAAVSRGLRCLARVKAEAERDVASGDRPTLAVRVP